MCEHCEKLEERLRALEAEVAALGNMSMPVESYFNGVCTVCGITGPHNCPGYSTAVGLVMVVG